MSEKGLYIFSIQEFCNDIWNIFTNVTFVKYYKTNFFMKRDCRKSDETEPSVTHQSSKTFCCITLYLFLNCKFLEMCPFPTISYRYNTTVGSFEKCDHFPDWGWGPATGSEGFTKLEPGKGYWVMAENDCVCGHEI